MEYNLMVTGGVQPNIQECIHTRAWYWGTLVDIVEPFFVAVYACTCRALPLIDEGMNCTTPRSDSASGVHLPYSQIHWRCVGHSPQLRRRFIVTRHAAAFSLGEAFRTVFRILLYCWTSYFGTWYNKDVWSAFRDPAGHAGTKASAVDYAILRHCYRMNLFGVQNQK